MFLNMLQIGYHLYSLRILLESAISNCDKFHITKGDVKKIMDWEYIS